MEDVADVELEEGTESAPAIAPDSDDNLSGDDSEREEPANLTIGEDDNLSDISSLDETYRCPSLDDSHHEESSDDDDGDDGFELAENLAGMHAEPPHSTSQQPGQRGSAQETPQRAEPSDEPFEPHTEAYPRAGFVRGRIAPGFHKSAQAQSSLGAGNAYYPFANETDFELGAWLHESGLPMEKIDEFLKLKYVCHSWIVMA